MRALTVSDSRMTEIHIDRPLPGLALDEKVGGSAREVRVLVRLHDRPVGSLTVEVGSHGVAAADLAAAVWAAAPEARAHLAADGLPIPAVLDPVGLAAVEKTPRCIERRRAVLENPPSITVLLATRNREDSLRRCLASDRPGLARAHNRGLQEVTGSWVAITDDDVVVDRHWLTAIAEVARAAPGVACVTGPIVAAELETRAQRLIEEAGGFGPVPLRIPDQVDRRRASRVSQAQS
jgi:hypothetical protein